MTKEEVVDKTKELLKAGDDLTFLLRLGLEDLKTHLARIRERVEHVGR
jgi:hypothetical protein